MGNFIQSVIILFMVLISITGSVEVVYAQVGETVNLKPLELTKSHNYVYWKFIREDSHQIAWRNRYGGKSVSSDEAWKNRLDLFDDSLTIKDVQQQHFGKFEVTVNSETSPISTIILVKLKVSKKPDSLLLPGERLSLACSVESSKMPDIYWLGPTEKRTNNKGLLSMSVTASDNGTWTCVVAEKKRVKISVSVVDFSPAPSRPLYTSTSVPITIPFSVSPHISWQQIIQEVHWQFFPQRSSVVSKVEAQSLFFLSVPSMTLTADQNRDLVLLKDLKTGNFTLSRKNGRTEDTGDYMCTMISKNGTTLNRIVHVDVLHIIASPGTELISGQPLNLTCKVGRSLPSDLRLQWSSPQHSVHYAAHLSIPEVSTVDGGNWECSLWEGKMKLTSAVITLNIESRLNVWMFVWICSAAVIVILLVILIFILYRRRNRKMRHLRHQLCRCKNPKPKGFYRT